MTVVAWVVAQPPDARSLRQRPAWTWTSVPPTPTSRSPGWPTARGHSHDRVRDVVQAHTQGRILGFLGEERVKVLELNLALRQLTPAGEG